MKNCAYCGRENTDDATNCRECGTGEFVVAGPPPLPQQKAETVDEFPELEPDVSPDEERALCTACLFPNVPDTTWCKRCGAPIGPTTGIVPTDAALSMGYVYRGAVRGRPKPVVFAGVWVLFFPGFIANIILLLRVLGGRIGGGAGLAAFWFAVAGGAVCSMMLYRVTRNYLSIPKREPDETAG